MKFFYYLVIRIKVTVILTNLLFLFIGSQVFGQERSHVAGDVHLRITSGGYFFSEWQTPEATFTFPAGWKERNNLFYQSTSLLTDYDIILDDAGSTGPFGVWPGNSQEFNNVPVSIKKYVRNIPPVVMVDGALLTQPFSDIHDPDLPADEMIEVKYVMNSEPSEGYPGMLITQRSYSFVNQNHSQYIIFDLVYKYTQQKGSNIEEFMPDNPLDCWLITFNGFANCMYGAKKFNIWDEYAGYNLQDDIASHIVFSSKYSATRDNLVLSYSYDGDSPETEADDIGDPYENLGEFLSPQYTGFAYLHVDESADNETDDIENPFSVGVDYMDNLWYDDPNVALETFTTGTFIPSEEIISNMSTNWQATKKYHFEKDDDIHLVYVMGAASAVTPEEAKEKGQQYFAGEMTDVEKNELLAQGLDSLKKVIDNAAFCFSKNYKVPAAPPSPDLTVTSGPDEITLVWEDVSNMPDALTGKLDFAGYRVYRSEGLRDTTYTKVYEGIETSYRDTQVTRGVAYYYYVVAFDDGTQNTDGLNPGQSLASSAYLNRTSVAAVAFKPGHANSDEVLVVPNPFNRSAAGSNFPGEPDKILFVNLPPICTIRIYTVTGNLVKKIEHTSGSADESWDTITAFNQYIASGIYIFRIDGAKTWDGNALASSYGKFIVIR